MKILYIGNFCEPGLNEMLIRSESIICQSTNSFQRFLLQEFEHRTIKPDYIINVPSIGSFPYRSKKLFWRESYFEYASMRGINCRYFNLSVIKSYSIYKSLFKRAKSWMEANGNMQKLIIVYSLIYPYIKTAVRLKDLYSNTKICCIVPDLPEYFDDSTSTLYRTVNAYYTNKIYELSSKVDSFVLFTSAMADRLNVGLRPWLLIEGVYSPTEVPTVDKLHKTILYTGKLDSRFNIRDMIEAFRAIPDNDFSLWICGDGTERDFVCQSASEDSRIKYWGTVEQKQVFKMQKMATLLINPRKGGAEYTKYSFPSKTMEYMASGTPTMMYRLPAMPPEYEKHLLIFPDESTETMTKMMITYGTKDADELQQFGDNARKFILENKSVQHQVDLLINFIQSI